MAKKLKKVKPEHAFQLIDGGELRNLEELAHMLEGMNHQTFQHHVNTQRNDFYNWIKDVIQDEELAKRIRFLKSRLLMRSVIQDRIEELGGIEEPEEAPELAPVQRVEYKQEAIEHPLAREEDTPSHVEEAIGIKRAKKPLKAALLEFGIGLTVGATSMFILARYVF